MAICSFLKAGVSANWTPPAEMVSKGWRTPGEDAKLLGEDAKLLWLLAPGLANGKVVCLFFDGVPVPVLLARLAGVRSMTSGFLTGVAGGDPVAGGVPGLLGESGPPPKRPAKHALMPRALGVVALVPDGLVGKRWLEPKAGF